MASQQTAEEVKREYLAVLGPDLGVLFYHLRNEVIWLNWKWQEYTTLFGSTPERIDLLNRAAPAFFRVVQDSLWEDMLLHIARLTDPPQSVGKDNLTVTRLPGIVAEEIRPAVDAQLQVVLDRADFARDWRKRHIAHRDFALATGKTATPLARASRLMARRSIEAINALLNMIDTHYRKTETYFAGELTNGNAESLLYVLRDGLEAEEQRKKRLETGRPLPEDVAHRPPV